MKPLLGATIAVLLIAGLAAPHAVVAQQKTARECRDEWRANKDANKSAGVTEKDYVAKCRAGAAATQPATAPTAAPAPKAATPAAAPPTSAKAKTARECRDEWRANKDANKSAGVTEKDYVAKCRAGGAAPAATAPAAPAPGAAAPAAPAATAPAPAPTAAAPAKPTPAAPAPAPTAAAPAKPTPAAPAPTGANQYSTEVQAKARCPSDTVVWVNLDSKIYHFSGYRNYGKTKEGAYMCEKDAMGAAFNAAKNEKHP